MAPAFAAAAEQKSLRNLERFTSWVKQHWLGTLCALWGIWVVLPFLAPVFMKMNMSWAARGIYLFYSVQCHQFPQRSFFLFGEKLTYDLSEFAAPPIDLFGQFQLRQFVGNLQMGWKVAWSDRMVWLYGGIWLFSLLYAVLRRRVVQLPLVLGVILLLPLVLDGASHALSDMWGLGDGFRDSNAWLHTLTNSAFADSFYRGDTWGSFNSLMRLITGLLSAWALVWMILPRIDNLFAHES